MWRWKCYKQKVFEKGVFVTGIKKDKEQSKEIRGINSVSGVLPLEIMWS